MRISLNDIGCTVDILEDYASLRRVYSVEETVAMVLNERKCELDDDEAPFVWIALAKAQIRRKELVSEVVEKAAYFLDHLPEEYQEKVAGLHQIRDRLHNPDYHISCEAAKEVPRKKKYFHCSWKIGDIYAYQLNSIDSEDAGLKGCHVLLRKADEIVGYPHKGARTVPLVYVMLWKGKGLPSTAKDIMGAEYIRLYKHRYRFIFDITSEKQIRDLNLAYIGNFAELDIPEDERYGVNPVVLDVLRPKELDAHVSDLYQRGFHFTPGRKSWNSDLS